MSQKLSTFSILLLFLLVFAAPAVDARHGEPHGSANGRGSASCKAECQGGLADSPGCKLCLGTYICPAFADVDRPFEEGLGIDEFGLVGLAGVNIFLWLFYVGMALAGILALTFIVIGGTQYIAGAGNSGMQTQAKERIRNALLGLLLALASTLILYTINPDLTTLEFPAITPPPPLAQSQSNWVTYCNCIGTTSDIATGVVDQGDMTADHQCCADAVFNGIGSVGNC